MVSPKRLVDDRPPRNPGVKTSWFENCAVQEHSAAKKTASGAIVPEDLSLWLLFFLGCGRQVVLHKRRGTREKPLSDAHCLAEVAGLNRASPEHGRRVLQTQTFLGKTFVTVMPMRTFRVETSKAPITSGKPSLENLLSRKVASGN